MKMRLFIAAAAAGIAFTPSPALAWGKTGHRVVAALAEAQLSGLAKAHVRELLGVESLDEAANWPDEMRSDPSPFWQKASGPLHYVTLNGVVYDHAPPEGDAIEALAKFSATLRNPNASLADKQLALRFIVHLVGDLHQPLHAGKCCDRGGNEVKVKWFGKDQNLHSVWDSSLVDDEQLSFTELAAKLQRHTSNEDVIRWWNVNPRDWVSESARIRDTVYPAMPAKGATDKDGQPALPELSYSYVHKFSPVMEQRLKQAGVRLAAYLDAIYAEPTPLPPEPQR
ncbi:MAG TPA: S1/P1 nuclease [Sphingomicrobium sp.]|nr:S1/P1 nuclease [Sphingomicrobium sp.]